MSKFNKILLSGFIDLGPIGRHGLSFISTLIQDKRNIIYIDSDYLLKDSKKNNPKAIAFVSPEARS